VNQWVQVTVRVADQEIRKYSQRLTTTDPVTIGLSISPYGRVMGRKLKI